MNRVIHEQWKHLTSANHAEMRLVVDRSAELNEIHRLLDASKQRALLIEGSAGTGKTALASQFVINFGSNYTGGVEFQTAFWGEHQSSGAITNNGRGLLIFDGLDESILSARASIDYIASRLEKNRNLFALVLSRPLPEINYFERIALGSMSLRQINRILQHHSGDSTHPPQEISELAAGNPLLASIIGMLASNQNGWPDLISSLQSFWRPGLVDPQGQPLEPLSDPARTFITGVREVNDWIMHMIRRDPDIIFQLTPRRFEEISAEMFTRLGYDVTLTPAIKDGGKDLILVKHSDIGTMLTFVECKLYDPARPVGVEIIRALNGVVEAGRATSGLLLTTSRFTKGAHEEQRQMQYRLTLKDYIDFKSMLDRALPQVTI